MPEHFPEILSASSFTVGWKCFSRYHNIVAVRINIEENDYSFPGSENNQYKT